MRRLFVFTVSLGGALFVATANAGASSPPTIRQVASIIAGHQQAIENDQAAEDSCLRSRMPECDLVQARVDRATADARDSLSLATELENAVGKRAQRAPKKIRSLVNQTINQARTVVDHTNKWLACLKAHAGSPASACDRSLGYLDNFFKWPAILDRWRPYLS
jgi:hypothetical protein